MRRKRIPQHAGVTPSGDGFRIQVIDPTTGRRLSAFKVLGIKGRRPADRQEADQIAWDAEAVLNSRPDGDTTVENLIARWLHIGEHEGHGDRDPWKESTRRTNVGRVKAFREAHGDKLLVEIDDALAERWARGPKRNAQVLLLREVWVFAASRAGGRLVTLNPWDGLGKARGSNREKETPKPEVIDKMIDAGYKILPAFGAWLEFACFTGCRPGEIDALRWEDIDSGLTTMKIERQFSSHAQAEDTPKNGRRRDGRVFIRAQRALARMHKLSDQTTGYVFVGQRGNHFTAPVRHYYWKQIVKAVPELADCTLYLATRHFAGWYMVNELEMESEDVAIQLGHVDGGILVRQLYGHRDRGRALRRLADADRRFQGEDAA